MMHPAETFLARYAQSLNRLDQRALRVLQGRFQGQQTGRWGDDLIRYAGAAYKLASDHARVELSLRHRSYAADLPEEPWQLSDYYKDYLVDLAGVADKDLLERTNQTLAAAERGDLATTPDGGPANVGVDEVASALADVFNSFSRSRLHTIVRTEGTRVSSAARRDVAAAARPSGYGPDYLIFSAITDDRVTHTCGYAHRHKRTANPEDALWQRIPPPCHYNCRSLERYGYAWDERDQALPDWTDQALREFEDIRAREFPGWSPQPLPPSRLTR